MKDPIERQDAIDAIFSEPLYESGMKKRDADVVVPAIYKKIKSLPSAQPEPQCDECPDRQEARQTIAKYIAKEQRWIPCSNCARNADNGGLYPDGRTRCPIQEHYTLPKDGYYHLAEPWEGEEHGVD